MVIQISISLKSLSLADCDGTFSKLFTQFFKFIAATLNAVTSLRVAFLKASTKSAGLFVTNSFSRFCNGLRASLAFEFNPPARFPIDGKTLRTSFGKIAIF